MNSLLIISTYRVRSLINDTRQNVNNSACVYVRNRFLVPADSPAHRLSAWNSFRWFKDIIPGTAHEERNLGGGASAQDGPMLRLQPSITSPMVSEKSSKWNKTRFWVDRGDRDIILLAWGTTPPSPQIPSSATLPMKKVKITKIHENFSLAPCCCFQSILNS